jgi:hypothetical protein
MTLRDLMRRPLLATILAVALVSAGSAVGWAQAARVPSFIKLPDAVVAEFKANPHSLLATYSSAGLPLSTEVRGLVLTDPSLVDALIDVAKDGNDAQKGAIGAGLAGAARILAATNPQLAAQVQLKVAQSGMGPLITAFIAGSNGIETAAIGGGGGGTAGGSGGPTGGVVGAGGSNGGANFGGVSFGFSNGFTGFSGGGAGGSTFGASFQRSSVSPSS